MPLPFELTDFPTGDMVILRRLGATNDSDVQFLLSLFANTLRDMEARISVLQRELNEIEEEIEESAPGRPAFGDGEGEMEIVRRILGMKNKSLRQIAAALNDQGVLTATGKQWQAQTVSNVLKRYGPRKATHTT